MEVVDINVTQNDGRIVVADVSWFADGDVQTEEILFELMGRDNHRLAYHNLPETLCDEVAQDMFEAAMYRRDELAGMN